MSTTIQAILTAVFPAGIPPERYEDLPIIQRKVQELANIAGGWTQDEIDKCSLRGISTDDLVDKAAFINKAEIEREIQSAPAEPITGKYPRSGPGPVKVQPADLTGADIAYLKDRGHTWQEIAVTTGLTQDKARHLYRKWQKVPSDEEQISALIASMDSPNALDIEILQAVKRQFSGCGLTVADVRARRRKA